MHGCGEGNTSVRGRQSPWQGPPPRNSLVLPLRGGSSAMLPALFVGAGSNAQQVLQVAGLLIGVTPSSLLVPRTPVPLGCGQDCRGLL